MIPALIVAAVFVVVGVIGIIVARSRIQKVRYEREKDRERLTELRDRLAETQIRLSEAQAAAEKASSDPPRQQAEAAVPGPVAEPGSGSDVAASADPGLLADSGAFSQPGGDSGGPAASVQLADRATLESLWALEHLALDRARRELAKLSTAPSDVGPSELSNAVHDDVERIREEIGTPGAFHSELTRDPVPARALLALRTAQTALAILARRTEAFDLYLHEWEGRVNLVVVCEGLDEETAIGPTSDLQAVRRAISAASGDIQIGRDDTGRFQVRVSVPAL